MTNDELRRAQQRIADARAQRRADVGADARPPAPTMERLAGLFTVGDRVLDLRTGREGDVDAVGLPVGTRPAPIAVRYDDGERAQREPADLLARPRPPAGRS